MFPLPIDLIRPLLESGGGEADAAEATQEAGAGLTSGDEGMAPAVAAPASRAEPGHNGPA